MRTPLIATACLVLGVAIGAFGFRALSVTDRPALLVDRAAEDALRPAADAVAGYLEAQADIAFTSTGGTSFCAFRTIGAESTPNLTRAYLLVRCEEFVENGGTLRGASGRSGPMVVLLSRGRVTAHQAPGDGAAFSEDIRFLFPEQLHEKAFSHEFCGAWLPQPVPARASAALGGTVEPAEPGAVEQKPCL